MNDEFAYRFVGERLRYRGDRDLWRLALSRDLDLKKNLINRLSE